MRTRWLTASSHRRDGVGAGGFNNWRRPRRADPNANNGLRCGRTLPFLGSRLAIAQRMADLGQKDLLLCFVGLAVVLFSARGLGALARALRQPEVVGELVAGFLLGPSALGALFRREHELLLRSPPLGHTLSAFSWMGAILLLLVAGFEVDLVVLRRESWRATTTSIGGVLAPLAAGTAFAVAVLHAPVRSAFFLGVVLSVSAVTVITRLLIEREALRRRYAQVTIAAGIASEVAVWPLVAMLAARSGPPLLALARAAVFTTAFFVAMLTLGRSLTFRAFRWVSDVAGIRKGQISLVLVLLLLAAAATTTLGLHPLLGAFVLGVVLRKAPRIDRPLFDSVQTLATGLFGPVFFALAGMRIDVRALDPGAWLSVLALLLVATSAKVGAAAVGAWIGGIRGWEAILVGLGVDMRGGTDVVVATIGAQLGLLSPQLYTTYALVAIATAVVTPVAFGWTERHAPPSPEESRRLREEEAAEHAYGRQIERVLVPVAPQFLPATAATMVAHVASAKRAQNENFDVTELTMEGGEVPPRVADAIHGLQSLARPGQVRVSEQRTKRQGVVRGIVDAATGHDLVALAAQLGQRSHLVSFGRIQDAIVRASTADVLLVVDRPSAQDKGPWRILVPVNGSGYSLSAADLAAHVASATRGSIVLFHVAHGDPLFWQERDDRRLRSTARFLLDDVEQRIARLGVPVEKRVQVGVSAAREIVSELRRRTYQLVVLGTFDRSTGGLRPSLGTTTESVACQSSTSMLVLVCHAAPGGGHPRLRRST